MFKIVIILCIVSTVSFLYFFLSSTKKKILYGKDSYKVIEYHSVLTPSECKEIIELAKKKGLKEAQVYKFDKEDEHLTNGVVHTKNRTSKAVFLDKQEHPILQKISNIVVNLTGLPSTNQEQIQVAMYEDEGFFTDHFDGCDSTNKEYCKKFNKGAGERKYTYLLYLNDSYEGGETEFMNAGIVVKPEKGKAILFENVDEKEEILQMSKHRGNPVKKGEKWICTVWSHTGIYP